MNTIPDNVFMLDIETLGTKPGCAIGSIGCVSMNNADKAFYRTMNYRDQPNYTTDPDTIQFWARESDEAYNAAFAGTLNSWIALKELKEFLGQNPILWCRGMDFDPPILADLYERLGLAVPWKYNSTRDLRTLIKVLPALTYAEQKHKHHALEDAKYQRFQLLSLHQIYDLKLD